MFALYLRANVTETAPTYGEEASIQKQNHEVQRMISHPLRYENKKRRSYMYFQKNVKKNNPKLDYFKLMNSVFSLGSSPLSLNVETSSLC